MGTKKTNVPPRTIGELSASVKSLQLIKAWKECSGPALATQTLFLGIYEINGVKTLFLEIKDALWRQELEYQKHEILKVFVDRLRNIKWANSELPQKIELVAHSYFLNRQLNPKSNVKKKSTR